jgi:hypothetical protein
VTVNFGEELGESLYQHESLGGISEDVRLCGFARVAVYTILRKSGDASTICYECWERVNSV